MTLNSTANVLIISDGDESAWIDTGFAAVVANLTICDGSVCIRDLHLRILSGEFSIVVIERAEILIKHIFLLNALKLSENENCIEALIVKGPHDAHVRKYSPKSALFVHHSEINDVLKRVIRLQKDGLYIEKFRNFIK